jgi:hypothetical protein
MVKLRNLANLAKSTKLANLACPPEWQLTRAVSDGARQATLARHLAGCARCAATFATLREIANAAPALSPVEPLSAGARRDISAGLWEASTAPGEGAPLRAGTSGLGRDRRDRSGARARRWLPGGWPGLAAVAGALVVLVIGLGVLRPRRPPAPEVAAQLDRPTSVAPRSPSPSPSRSTSGSAPPTTTGNVAASRASIRVTGGARFVRFQAPPDEIVRLSEGTLELEVAPLGAHERFRVITGDSEVEVKGTHFRVTAADNRLTSVYVWHGRVEVRSPAGAEATLQGGDAWVPTALPPHRRSAGSTSRPPSAAGPPRSEPATPSATREALAETESLPDARAARPGPTEAAPGQAAASFDRAWRLLRAGNAAAAADAFAEVERHDGGAAIAEDAAYWSAVARGRAGDSRAAITAFGGFLARFPSSARVGAAETALGWLLVESGQPDRARHHFDAGARDPSPRVRASAQEGLDRTRAPEH